MGWVSRLAVAVVFAVAAFGKFTGRQEAREAVAAFGVPEHRVGIVAWALPCVEAAVAIAVLPSATAVWAGACALILLGVFSALVAVRLARGEHPACACFGTAAAKPIGPGTLVRNALIAAVAGAALWGALARPGLPEALPGVPAWGLAIAAALAGVPVWQGLSLRDLRSRLAEANTPAPPDGLPIGTPAPQFTLPTPDGTTRTLAHWQETGRPLALVFLHPGCGPCRKLAGDLPDALGQRTDGLQVLVVASGTPADNALWATDYGLTDVLVQDHNEVAAQCRLRGTPSTVLLDPSGRIAAPTASGPTASRELLATTIRCPRLKGTA